MIHVNGEVSNGFRLGYTCNEGLSNSLSARNYIAISIGLTPKAVIPRHSTAVLDRKEKFSGAGKTHDFTLLGEWNR